MAMRVYDVAILGGGPAGATAALVLARGGLRVLLIDSSRTTKFKIGESLPPAALPLLRDLGLLDILHSGNHTPSPGNVSAWGSDELIGADFTRNPHGSGWHLDRIAFDRDLQEVAANAGADVRLNCMACDFRFLSSEQLWFVCLCKERANVEFKARWLIDATGRRGVVAKACGVKARIADKLLAHYAVFPAKRNDQDNRTCVESARSGWWYTALLPNQKRLVAFFSDYDLPSCFQLRDSALFAKGIRGTCHIRCLVPEYRASTVRTCIAHSAIQNAFHGKTWIAVGDATLAFDPLSSQGLFHAFYTGMRGAKTVIDAVKGKDEALGTYENQLRLVEQFYRAHLSDYYSTEQRWPDEVFWRRRLRPRCRPVDGIAALNSDLL